MKKKLKLFKVLRSFKVADISTLPLNKLFNPMFSLVFIYLEKMNSLYLFVIFSQVLILKAKLASIRYPEFPFPPKICLKFTHNLQNLTQVFLKN